MALNIDEFQAEISQRGVQHSNRFSVTFNPPSNLRGPVDSISDIIAKIGGVVGNNALPFSMTGTRQLSLRCVAAVFPGIHLMTKDDIRRYGYGPVDKTVHGAQFGDIECGFILDSYGVVYDLLNSWQRLAIDSDSSNGMGSSKGRSPYEVGYKDSYATEMKITQYKTNNRPTLECTAQKAFPITVGQIQHSWGETNNMAVLPVTFSYRDHKIKRF